MADSNIAQQVRLILEQTGEKTVEGASAGLKKAAYETASLVAMFAPMDTGALRGSVTVDEEQPRDAGGHFMAKTFTIRLNGSDYNYDEHQYVGEYAYEVHEKMAPYGSGDWGTANPVRNEDVGGKFFDRAGIVMSALVGGIVADAVRKGLREGISVGVRAQRRRRK